VLDRNQRVCDAERQIFVGMDPDLGLGLQCLPQGFHPIGCIRDQQGTRGVGHVDAMRSVRFHQLCLLGQRLWRAHMRHHQEPGDVESEVARSADVLLRDIGFCAMGGDPDRADTGLCGILEVVDCADPRDQQRGQPGMLEHGGCRLDPLEVGVLSETIIEG